MQTSAMDCGPAALAALLNGCGIDVSYPRLREACQTDVDGTSIDTLEELANRFGLRAQQVMLPDDFLLDVRNDHLPCIAVVLLPNGLTHFVVIWSVRFGFYEVMDPARGRSWMRRAELESMLYGHEVEVDAGEWQEYATSAEFQDALRRGLADLGFAAAKAQAWITEASSEEGGWQKIATLDAAVRMCRMLDRSGERVRGRAAAWLLELAMNNPSVIPAACFQVNASDTPGALRLRGAVVLEVAGVVARPVHDDPVIAKTLGGFRLPVVRRLASLMREMGVVGLGWKLAAVGVAMGSLTFVEALVFRYLLGFQAPTELWTFWLVLGAVLLPSIAMLATDVGHTRFGQTLGRQLETRLRAQLLYKLPRIRDDYFASRLASDLAERGHAISELRAAPGVVGGLLVSLSRIALLLIGLTWLLPGYAWIVAISGTFAIFVPFGVFRVLAERDIRARTHVGSLSNLYLDGLRGTEPVWTHGAARSLAVEHESLLVRWVRAANRLRSAATLFELVQVAVLGACGIALVHAAIAQELPRGSILLVAYWALFVPMLSRGVLSHLKQLPSMYNILLRVFEVLDAPEEVQRDAVRERESDAPAGQGVALDFRAVSVVRGTLPVIADLNLAIAAGEHVAIVGASGSGKSSFLGAISGFHIIAAGEMRIDGVAADPEALQQLRQSTALVDPETYLWNRELYANVMYGLRSADVSVDGVLRDSELLSDLEKMPDGLATRVGENGSRLSGGEAQRLRVARALARGDARLVLLDEPFSGMDSDQRRRMYSCVLDRWRGATLLWVSHHVSETVAFPRVLVFEGGRIVEDGAPASLLEQDSRYAAMVGAEVELQRRLLGGSWRAVDIGRFGQVPA